jgi:hypothetical protein
MLEELRMPMGLAFSQAIFGRSPALFAFVKFAFVQLAGE